jgi:hypothetical protein
VTVRTGFRDFGGEPEPARPKSHDFAIGCLVVVAVLVLLAAVALSSIHVGGNDATPYPVNIANRWAQRDVVLTPAAPAEVVRITFHYNLGSGAAAAPAVVVGTPTDGQPSQPSGASANLGLGIDEPAVEMRVVGSSGPIGPCAAPCERPLQLPQCSGACTATFDVRLSLLDAAGRDEISVTLDSGLSVPEGSPLPDGFDVEIAAPGPARGDTGGAS